MVDRFQKLIDQSADAILIDVGGRIVYVNNATVRLFGAASPAEMLGRSRLEFTLTAMPPSKKESRS